jgi:hypothetical protein
MDEEMAEDTKLFISWKIILEKMTAKIVINEVGVLVYNVLSKEEKHVPYGETVGTTECTTLYPRCRTKWVHITRFNCVLCD